MVCPPFRGNSGGQRGRSPIPRRGMALAACAAMPLAAACGPEDDPEETFVALEPSAESTAPLSESNGIAVTPEGIACVIDSYEIRIYCADRDDRTVDYFGREGDGPGEFIGPTSIDRAPDGGIVVVDMERGRLLWFLPTGELLSESKAPAAFIPTGRIAGSLFGKALVSDENVEVDVHEGVAYFGTVRVRHSLIGMDIAGSVLVVPVDRPGTSVKVRAFRLRTFSDTSGTHPRPEQPALGPEIRRVAGRCIGVVVRHFRAIMADKRATVPRASRSASPNPPSRSRCGSVNLGAILKL